MKRACFILTLLLALHQAHSENEVPSLPNEVQVRLRAGMNALAITRFPQTNPGEPLAEKLSLATVFGPENEAELQSGTANTADIIWIHQGQGSWERFYFGTAISPTGETTSGWRRIGDDRQDQGDFSWPYTEGVLIERRNDAPHTFSIHGTAKLTPTPLRLQKGAQYFNRVIDGPITLSALGLEEFFVRAPEDRILAMAVDVVSPNPRPDALQLDADQFLEPVSGSSFVLSEKGEWYLLGTRQTINPKTLLVPGSFGIQRVGEATPFAIPAPVLPLSTPAKLLAQPFLALGEGAVRQLRVANIGPPECVCAFLLHNNRPISLHVIETNTGHAVVRVGKHPANVVTDSLAIVNGKGVTAPFRPQADLFTPEQALHSFLGTGPLEDPQPYVTKLPNLEQRDNAFRFFSKLDPQGNVVLELNLTAWPKDSLLEIDFLAASSDGRKVALHFPRIRLAREASATEFAGHLAELLTQALVERQLVPAGNIKISLDESPEGASITLGFESPLLMGKLDVCAEVPAVIPTIDRTSNIVSPTSLIEVLGRDFGSRIDDLCLVLAPSEGTGPTIPLRPVSLSADGTRLLARVVGPINDGRTLRVMMARGFGRTRPIHLGFPDVLVRQGIWVWRGSGQPAVISPSIIRPALGQGETMHFTAALKDGGLELKLDQPWPENAEVSISFTANTESVQLDSYAPELCFTVSGSAEECAERLKRVLEAAFVQGGMANANQVQVELDVTPDGVTLSANVFTDDGVNDPITSGHMNISVTEGENPCAPPDPDDTDGDLVEDNWERHHFEMEPEEVDSFGDPDSDSIANHLEFALATDPFTTNGMSPLLITLDATAHPVISYRRHISAPNYYHFDIETSANGNAWERLANLEILTIQPVGDSAEIVIARSLANAHTLNASFYRLQITPRS